MNGDPLENLPHGPEFRFLDSLKELDPGKSGVAVFTVPDASRLSFLEGHFPGRPILPGVICVEAIAQLAGVVAQCDPEHGALPNLLLTAIRAAKILGAAEPGQQLVIQAAVDGRLGGLIQASGTVHAPDGKMICQAQVTLAGGG